VTVVPTYRVSLRSPYAAQTVEQLKYNDWRGLGGADNIPLVLTQSERDSVYKLGEIVADSSLKIPADDLTDWTYHSAALAPALSDDHEMGTASIKMGTDGSSTFGFYRRVVDPPEDRLTWGDNLYLKNRVYIAEEVLDLIFSITIKWYDSANPSVNNMHRIYSASELSGGWNEFYEPLDDWDYYGHVYDRFYVSISLNSADPIDLGQIKYDGFLVDSVSDENMEIGQKFTVKENAWISGVSISAVPVGNPAGGLKCELGRLSGGSWTLIAESPDVVTPSADGKAVFSFPDIELTAGTGGTVYAFKIYCENTQAPGNYWEVSYNSSDVLADGHKFIKNSSGYSEQTEQDLYFEISYSTNPIKMLGQTFHTTDEEMQLSAVRFWLDTVGTPTDEVRCQIYDSAGNLLNTSPTTASSAGQAVFPLPCALDANETYMVLLSRTGSDDENNYWTVAINHGKEYDDGELAMLGDDMGGNFKTACFSGIDAKFMLEYSIGSAPLDITEDVREINIDRGISDLTGKIKQGSASLVMDDSSGKYRIGNTSSPLAGVFDYMKEISIQVIYDGQVYDRFVGFVTDAKPKAGLPGKTVIELRDMLFRFQKTKVSIGNQTGKTASELVNLLLAETDLDITDYDVANDDFALAEVSWDDVGLLDKLAVIVECGRHVHFIDRRGRYVWRTNQWLMDSEPAYSFSSYNVQDYQLVNKLDNIVNKVSVVYPTGTAVAEDFNAQALYGLREYELDNELMPDDVYAQAIADYILEERKHGTESLTFTLEGQYPEILELDFGDRIAFTDDRYGIDSTFVVEEINETIAVYGKHRVRIKARRWQQPTIIAYRI